MRILYIPNNCSTTGHLPLLVWGGIRATTGELQPQNDPQYARCFWLDNSLVSVTYSGHGMYSQATLGLLKAYVTGCDEFASNQLCVRRSLTIVSSIYSVNLNAV